MKQYIREFSSLFVMWCLMYRNFYSIDYKSYTTYLIVKEYSGIKEDKQV